MESKFTLGLNEDARLIRQAVFCIEQGFNDEFDDIDSFAHHVVIYDNKRAVATGRVFKDQGDVYIIGRVAVIKEMRKMNLGRKLLKLLEEKAQELKASTVVLTAQVRAEGFYEKLGYYAFGEELFDEGVAHIKMSKELIHFKNIKDFKEAKLAELFLSVHWESGKYPKQLNVAIKNYGTVFSAWHGNKLVGLVATMDDGIMNAYIHYLLVNPNYQAKSIGSNLIKMVKDHYCNYLRIVVVAYNEKVDFYKKSGFNVDSKGTTMNILNEIK